MRFLITSGMFNYFIVHTFHLIINVVKLCLRHTSFLLFVLQRTQCETQTASQWRHGSDETSWLQSGQDSDRNIAEVVETVGGESHHPLNVPE